jgi:hypothetical protein
MPQNGNGGNAMQQLGARILSGTNGGENASSQCEI